MCTLTYLPTQNGDRIITANRDESPLRNARELTEYLNNQKQDFFIAREPLRGGTNMAISPRSRMVVLLNGAFDAHEMGQKYRKSRGILLLESLDCKNAFEYADQNSLEGIEPFTLVEFQNEIRELRWDGNEHFKKVWPADRPMIWASAQLYSEGVRKKREKWFLELLEENPNQERMLKFHFSGGDGDVENDLVMNRSGLVQTVSITQFIEGADKGVIKHFDLIEDSEQTIKFS